jgi:phosphate:Na+ symporter
LPFYQALLQLGGAIMMLLWAIRMLRSGVERGHGALLTRLTHNPRGGWPTSALTGLMTAALLQSSTAVALLVSSIAATGTLPLASALAMVLGADVGSALILQVLATDLSWLPALLAVVGGGLYMGATDRKLRQTGRIGLSIALVMISLGLIGEATAPLRQAPMLVPVVQYLSGDMVTAFLLGAIFTWVIHSSIASVLLIATFMGQGIIPFELALVLVLGANAGGGLIAVGLTLKSGVAARRIAVGNALYKLAFAGTTLAILYLAGFAALGWFASSTGIVQLHLLFNIIMLTLGLPFVGLLTGPICRLIPDSRQPALEASESSRLDLRVLQDPRSAETCAKREMLTMARHVEEMFDAVAELFKFPDQEKIKRIKLLESEVDRRHTEIKRYLARIVYDDDQSGAAWRCFALADFAVNLEFAADTISGRLVKLARAYSRQPEEFRPTDWDELFEIHRRVSESLQLSLNVMLSEDHLSARQLLSTKEKMALAERANVINHMQRLRADITQANRTSDIYLETMRAMRQINSMVASIALPFIDGASPGGDREPSTI